ncbi:MAG TPA: hypothetical protein VNW94_15790, partial [Streptosporangiaceae bacterium]|nr:hypothetical protein [Streptosporangiaceae bacterium]
MPPPLIVKNGEPRSVRRCFEQTGLLIRERIRPCRTTTRPSRALVLAFLALQRRAPSDRRLSYLAEQFSDRFAVEFGRGGLPRPLLHGIGPLGMKPGQLLPEHCDHPGVPGPQQPQFLSAVRLAAPIA